MFRGQLAFRPSVILVLGRCAGGVGSVAGVVTGVLIFTVINYGLTYIGVNPYWQYIIKGGIIIFAVALDSLKYSRKK